MQNYIESGENLEFTAAADVAAGEFVNLLAINGVSKGAVLTGATGVLMTSGVFLFPKLTSDATSVGTKVYWDAAAKKITITASTNKVVGYAVTSQLAADTTVKVKLTSYNA